MDLRRAASSTTDVPTTRRGTARGEPTGGSNGMVSSNRVGTGARSTGSRAGSTNKDDVLSIDLLSSNDGRSSSESEAREGGAGSVGVERKGSLGNSELTQTVAELSRRRLANDPAMMRELKRYRKLMLLTLLPAITSEADDHALIHPHAHAHAHAHTYPSHENGEGSPGVRGQPDGTDDPLEKGFSEHLSRPEPTDGVTASGQGAKSAGSHRGPSTRPHTHGPASAGTHLPLALRRPLDISPRPVPRRRSHEEASPRQRSRRRSQGDDLHEAMEEGDEGSRGAGGGDLDLLTLAALYLESRHRVLGREWHSRQDLPNIRPVGQLGSIGVARPRRLSPLSPSDSPLQVQNEGDEHEMKNYSSVLPTPAGLHLSVNYTQNLGLDESMYLAQRARALRPRLRRLSSMDNVSVADTPNSLIRNIHKATSAPDLSSSGHGRSRQDMILSRVSSQESISPPLVTPARANTPTEALHSAALARPQMVGGSLVTSLTVDTAKTVNINYGHRLEGLAVQPLKTQLPLFPEASRTVLPLPRPPFRSPRPPADPRVRDLPRTPPPTAASDGMRRGGRVHLEPLPGRKTSQ